MKIGLFTDTHYSSEELTCGARYNSRSLGKIKEAYAYFAAEKCDLVVFLGDLIDCEKEHADEIRHLREIADVIRAQRTPTVVLMGNHDGFAFTEEEFYGILGEEYKPKTLCLEGKTLVFVDACYFCDGTRYTPGGGDWTDSFVPDLNGLERELQAAGDFYVFMHQNADAEIREDHRIHNAAEFRALLEKSGRVKAVYQGHYHLGHTSERNGIRYVTLPAVCEGENRYFTEEI